MKLTVMNLTVAKELTDDKDGATYDVPYTFSKKLMKIIVTPEVASAEEEAEGQVVDRTSKVIKYKLGIDLSDLTLSERALLFGRTVLNGVETSNINDESPNFCVMYKARKRNRRFKYYKFFKVAFVDPKEEGDGSPKPQSQGTTIEGDAIPRIYDGVPRRIADEDEPTYTASIGANWFTSGDIIVDVTAPTIASTTPANNATGVVAGSTFAWVFSEAILPDSVRISDFFLIKDSDGSVVVGALTQSADRKTITFTPSSNLAAATAYRAIATKNVKDLSGNTLASNDVRKFTTA